MSEKRLSVGGNQRRIAIVSSQKVYSAFKSPCRPVSGSTNNGDSGNLSVHVDTPRPFPRKRKTALTGSFVSPLKSKLVRSEVTSSDIKKLEEDLKVQVQEIEELRAEGLRESDLSLYIDKLHEYNEIKDVAQMVIGRLAVQLQTTTKDLYTKFSLTHED